MKPGIYYNHETMEMLEVLWTYNDNVHVIISDHRFYAACEIFYIKKYYKFLGAI